MREQRGGLQVIVPWENRHDTSKMLLQKAAADKRYATVQA
jgi:hypothetical protein